MNDDHYYHQHHLKPKLSFVPDHHTSTHVKSDESGTVIEDITMCMTLLRIVCSCIFCPSAITAADRKYTLYSVSCLLSPLRHAAGPTFYSASGDFRGANATDSKKREGERASVAVTPDYLCCRGAFAAFAAFTAPAAHTAQA